MIQRHLTAKSRDALSVPIRALAEASIVRPGVTVMDYGCGRGDDVRLLRASGIDAVGWDPHWFPGGERRPSDVVNLGYVINVIEDPEERAATTRHAWALARHVIAISVMTEAEEPAGCDGLPELADGVVSSRGTFQRYFDPRDLRRFVALQTKTLPVIEAPGLVLAFRTVGARQLYLARRR